jgi:hydroxymethylglutaryl-CoA lyase
VTCRLIGLGCYEVSLGDTIGCGTPETVAAMLDDVLVDLPPHRLAGHFHDTGNRALDNVVTALEKGLRVFDSSVGGLGGCPYAPGAKGNVATEAVARRLMELGCATGIDLDRLDAAVLFAASLRSKP